MGTLQKSRHPWIQTSSGMKVYLHKPDPAMVNIRDIAEALSKLCRFNGHIQQFYSVAQHSCHVAGLLPPSAKPYGLLHDAHEAYTGDLITPVRETLRNRAGYDIWGGTCAPLEKAIHEAFGLPWPPHPSLANLIEEADRVALATEKRDLMNESPAWDVELPPADRKVIRPWPWPEAHHRFLTCFEEACRLRPEMIRAMQAGGRSQ